MFVSGMVLVAVEGTTSTVPVRSFEKLPWVPVQLTSVQGWVNQCFFCNIFKRGKPLGRLLCFRSSFVLEMSWTRKR